MTTARSYTAGGFAMQLEASDVGFVMSAEGGEVFGEVVEEAPVGVQVRKRLGGVRYAPIVVEAGPSTGDDFYAWVAAMLSGTQTDKSGRIFLLDYNLNELSRLEWKSALITEVAFPAADASLRESVWLRVTLQPEKTQFVAASGTPYQAKEVGNALRYLSSNFRFAVSGLEQAGAHTSKMAPIVVRRRGAGSSAVLEVTNLVLWLSEAQVAPYVTWLKNSMRGSDSGKRTAMLTFYDWRTTNELLRLEFEGVGIFRISHERQESGASAVAKSKVEMFCEGVRLFKAPAVSRKHLSESASAGATAESLAGALVAATEARSPTPAVPAADAIADRLLASAEAKPIGSERNRGRAAGRAWAAGKARIDELEDLAKLAERDEWTALALAEGHSLVAFLAAAGDVASGETGPIYLKRDDFTSGLAAGAADVYREVAPRLRERRAPSR